MRRPSFLRQVRPVLLVRFLRPQRCSAFGFSCSSVHLYDWCFNQSQKLLLLTMAAECGVACLARHPHRMPCQKRGHLASSNGRIFVARTVPGTSTACCQAGISASSWALLLPSWVGDAATLMHVPERGEGRDENEEEQRRGCST